MTNGCRVWCENLCTMRAPVLFVAATLSSALAAAFQTPAQTPPDPKFDTLVALVERKMAQYGVPGVAFGVVKDGQTRVRGLGLTNLDNPQPVTPNTVFPLASISKTLTATALMRLVEEGKVDLNARVRRYLPEFAVQDETVSREAAVWHLLTHTPGWEGQLNSEDRGAETLAHFITTMKDLPKLADPGEVWSYNNAGFNRRQQPWQPGGVHPRRFG